jgi:FMN reductase
MSIAVVTGNPKPGSRTLAAATLVAEKIAGGPPDVVVDIVELGAGLLKLFLDQIPTDGLAGVVAVPLMLGAGPGHALAPELFLKPVLVEAGATCPTKALFVLDTTYDDAGAYEPWLTTALPQIQAALGAKP